MIGYRARLGETGHSSVPTVLAPQRRMEDNAQGRDCVSSAIGEAIPRRLGVSLNASASFRGFRRLRARQADRTTCRRPSEQGRCLASPLRGNGMARGVRAIFDITNSGVGLAVQDLTKARDRIVIFDSASSSDFTGKACSPNGIQWNADNWSNGVALMRLLIKQKLDSFFFITADYAFGASLEADARDAIAKAGGNVVGSVRSPLNTADFSSFLIAAQASKAKVIVFAITGADLSNALKQASEFNLAEGQYLATPITYLSDVNAAGLDVAHGLTFMQSWYWDLNDKTREFAKRFYARRGRMPNDNQVAVYSSVRHYLEAVTKAQTEETAAVMKAMREAPIHDVFTANGTIRADGRVLYDRYLMRVKTPAESKYPWDYLAVVAKIPAVDAFRPSGADGCTLAAQ